MGNYRLPRITLCSGHGNKREPKKRFKDCLKKSLSACDINYHLWSTLAKNRDTWRLINNRILSLFENTRKTAPMDKRCRKRNWNTMPSNHVQPINFDRCDCACLFCIGFISYERACCRRGQPAFNTNSNHGDDEYSGSISSFDLVSYPARAEGLVNMISSSVLRCTYLGINDAYVCGCLKIYP